LDDEAAFGQSRSDSPYFGRAQVADQQRRTGFAMAGQSGLQPAAFSFDVGPKPLYRIQASRRARNASRSKR
jgi:hypothetical protein